MNCAEVRSLLAFRPVDALDEEEQGPVDQHLETCAPCRTEARALEEAFSRIQVPEAEEALPAALWTRVVKEIETPAHAAEPAAEPGVEVSIALSCAFCHDTLVRSEATYCASCLAPHHDDCWRQHGRCSAYGCEETHTVRPKLDLLPALPKKKRSSRARNGTILVLIFGTGSLAGVAAYQAHLQSAKSRELDASLTATRMKLEDEQGRVEKERAALEQNRRVQQEQIDVLTDEKIEAARKLDSERLQEAKADKDRFSKQLEENRRLQQDQIDTLTAQKNRIEDEKIEAARKFENERRQRQDDKDAKEREIAALRKALAPPLVSLHAKDMDLATVIAQVASQTKKTVTLAAGVHEKLTLDLDHVPWMKALALVARATHCAVFEHGGAVFSLEQPPRVTMQFTDANVTTLLKKCAEAAGKTITCDGDVQGDLTLDLHDVLWFEAVETIASLKFCYLGRREDVISVSAKPGDLGSPDIVGDGVHVWCLTDLLRQTADSLPQTLDAKIHCTDCDPVAWITLIARCCGRSVVFASDVSGKVTLDLTFMTYEDALRRSDGLLVAPHGEDCLTIQSNLWLEGAADPPQLEHRAGRAADHFAGESPNRLPFTNARKIEDLRLAGVVIEPGFARAVVQGPRDGTRACFVAKKGDSIVLNGTESCLVRQIDERSMRVEYEGKERILDLKGE